MNQYYDEFTEREPLRTPNDFVLPNTNSVTNREPLMTPQDFTMTKINAREVNDILIAGEDRNFNFSEILKRENNYWILKDDRDFINKAIIHLHLTEGETMEGFIINNDDSLYKEIIEVMPRALILNLGQIDIMKSGGASAKYTEDCKNLTKSIHDTILDVARFMPVDIEKIKWHLEYNFFIIFILPQPTSDYTAAQLNVRQCFNPNRYNRVQQAIQHQCSTSTKTRELWLKLHKFILVNTVFPMAEYNCEGQDFDDISITKHTKVMRELLKVISCNVCFGNLKYSTGIFQAKDKQTTHQHKLEQDYGTCQF